MTIVTMTIPKRLKDTEKERKENDQSHITFHIVVEIFTNVIAIIGFFLLIPRWFNLIREKRKVQ